MEKIKINNQVVHMRKYVKQAKVHVINKLTKQVKLLQNRKGAEAQVAKAKRKAERYLEEIVLFKKLKPDYVSKLALSKAKIWKDVLEQKTSTLHDRCLAVLASYEAVQKEVESFHSKNVDLVPKIPDLIKQWEQKTKDLPKSKRSFERNINRSNVKKINSKEKLHFSSPISNQFDETHVSSESEKNVGLYIKRKAEILNNNDESAHENEEIENSPSANAKANKRKETLNNKNDESAHENEEIENSPSVSAKVNKRKAETLSKNDESTHEDEGIENSPCFRVMANKRQKQEICQGKQRVKNELNSAKVENEDFVTELPKILEPVKTDEEADKSFYDDDENLLKSKYKESDTDAHENESEDSNSTYDDIVNSDSEINLKDCNYKKFSLMKGIKQNKKLRLSDDQNSVIKENSDNVQCDSESSKNLNVLHHIQSGSYVQNHKNSAENKLKAIFMINLNDLEGQDEIVLKKTISNEETNEDETNNVSAKKINDPFFLGCGEVDSDDEDNLRDKSNDSENSSQDDSDDQRENDISFDRERKSNFQNNYYERENHQSFDRGKKQNFKNNYYKRESGRSFDKKKGSDFQSNYQRNIQKSTDKSCFLNNEPSKFNNERNDYRTLKKGKFQSKYTAAEFQFKEQAGFKRNKFLSKKQPNLNRKQRRLLTFGKKLQDGQTDRLYHRRERSILNKDKTVDKKGSNSSEKSLHPSWEAKRKQKELLVKSPFQGKRMVFDD